MQSDGLLSATGKRIEYLYKHMDKNVRGQFVAGATIEKEQKEREQDIFQGLNLDTKKSAIMHNAVSGQPLLLIKGITNEQIKEANKKRNQAEKASKLKDEIKKGQTQQTQQNPEGETEVDQFDNEHQQSADEDEDDPKDKTAIPVAKDDYNKKFNPFENLRMSLVEKVRQYE